MPMQGFSGYFTWDNPRLDARCGDARGIGRIRKGVSTLKTPFFSYSKLQKPVKFLAKRGVGPRARPVVVATPTITPSW